MTKGKEFNDWLLNRLGELGWEQGELASRAGVSSGAISNILHGRRSAGIDVVRKIAIALNEPEEKLFRMAGLMTHIRGTEEFKSMQELTEEIDLLTNEERSKVKDYVRFILFGRKRQPGGRATRKSDLEADAE